MNGFVRVWVSVVVLSSVGAVSAQSAIGGSVAERYLSSAANVDRGERGLPPLRVEMSLSVAALAHAREMARHGTISHQFAGEGDLAVRAGEAGVRFSIVTENVAEASDASTIHELWMHSAGHRANLLDPKVDSVGIAVVQRGGRLYAVEDFARTVAELTLEQQEATVGQLVAATGVVILPTSKDARETCALSSGYKGARKPWFTIRFTGAQLTELPAELSARLRSGKYREAIVAACRPAIAPFSGYSIAVLLYP